MKVLKKHIIKALEGKGWIGINIVFSRMTMVDANLYAGWTIDISRIYDTLSNSEIFLIKKNDYLGENAKIALERVMSDSFPVKKIEIL